MVHTRLLRRRCEPALLDLGPIGGTTRPAEGKRRVISEILRALGLNSWIGVHSWLLQGIGGWRRN